MTNLCAYALIVWPMAVGAATIIFAMQGPPARVCGICLLILAWGCHGSTGQPQDGAPPGAPAYCFGEEPVRYLENARIKLGIDLRIGGAITHFEDKLQRGGNMINSHDWGRQIQLSYYSGPVPFLGPRGERPHPKWRGLGWNPIQSGSVGNIASKTTAFERGPDFLRVRCVPMQWPLENVPGDCLFEATYRLVEENVVRLEARIINRRSDRAQYMPVHSQEMPAIYTNGPWFRLVAYLGDRPFTGGPLKTLVGKGDGKGWPWSAFYCPEHWAALVNAQGNGIGVHQAGTALMAGGFAGPDAAKGRGGPADPQTGYLAPLSRTILDHNIDWTYRTHLIAGSLDEIRAFASRQPRPPLPAWIFERDRCGWHYQNATDTGWPVPGRLEISFSGEPRGEAWSGVLFWRAQDAPVLEVEAAFEAGKTPLPMTAEVVLQPFGPGDTTDFPMWPDPKKAEATARKRQQFPPAIPLVIPFAVLPDGQTRVYRIPLAGAPGYTGAMKQVGLRFPAAGGRARIVRVALAPP
jgi:hypothetical protein